MAGESWGHVRQLGANSALIALTGDFGQGGGARMATRARGVVSTALGRTVGRYAGASGQLTVRPTKWQSVPMKSAIVELGA